MKPVSYLLFSILLIISSNMFSQTTPKPLNVAILIYNEVYLLDFAGPMEVMNDTWLNDTTQAFKVYSVAPNNDKIKCNTGTLIIPDFSIQNAPVPDILVIPGGNLNFTKEYPEAANWIKSTSAKTKINMSVCTGAFIIADLGLLDGLEATTWYGAKQKLQKKYPAIKVINSKRITDNGKIITTSGVSAGIDGALHLVEKLYGKEIALKTAKYIEYIWLEE
jgi:transcriptional regulator GlxA family with amidase domain